MLGNEKNKGRKKLSAHAQHNMLWLSAALFNPLPSEIKPSAV
jgi:hypothetical protein